MKKTNKLISFVCSLAMLSSAFTGVIAVKAEDTVPEETTEITSGIELQYDEEASTSKMAVIDVYAKGIPYVDAFQATFAIPEGAEYDTTAVANDLYESDSPLTISVIYSSSANTYTVSGYAGASLHDTAANQLLATIKIPFVNDLTEDAVLTLTGNSALTGYENADFTGTYTELSLGAGNLTATSVTVMADPNAEEPIPTATTEVETPTATATVEPTEEPYVTERPTMKPVPTAEPTGTPAPTPIVVESGIELQYDEEASTSKMAVIDVYAKGIPYVDAFQATFAIPEGAEYDTTAVANDLYESDSPLTISVIYSSSANTYTVSGYAGASLHDTAANQLLATIKIPFVNDLTEDAVLTLTGNSALTGYENADFTGTYTELSLGAGNLPAAFVVALANPNAEEPSEPVASETPAFDNDGEIKLSDLIKNAPATDDTLGNLVAVVVEATVGNDAAVYGEDFVAEYNDEELTEDEYFNLINGYTETDMTKVIDGLVFLVNDGVTVKASPAYQTEDQAAEGTMTVVPGLGGEQTYTNATEAPGKDEVTLTVEEPTHGSITVSYTVGDNSYSYDTDDDGDIEVNIPSGTSVKFKASADRNYEFSRWGDDLSGTSTSKTVTVNKDMTVSARFTKVDDSSSSSSGSGSSWNTTNPNGPIAGSGSQVGGGTTGFQDLGSVPWAQTAINSLTSAGIINGRSSTIFDPNASVTRAEFAKMVCLTFGITEQTTGTQRFTDVGPSDWFYGYVQAAAATGIVNGVSDTAFDPNATIKRQEMAAMLYRAISATGNLAKLPAGSAITFVDADQIDDYAQTPVSTLSAAGVINGTTDNQFEPLATATRAQAACIIYQYLTAVQ